MTMRARLLLTSFCVGLAALAPNWHAARAASTPQIVDIGATDPAKIITVTLHLIMRDEAGFQAKLASLYDRTSPSFHHWMTDADLKQFAPEQSQRDAVSATLKAGGLTLLPADKNGFFVRARGTVADVARVFNTELHDFSRNGEIFRNVTRPAVLAGSAGAYVKTVAGLASHQVHPMLTRAKNNASGKAYSDIPIKSLKALGGLAGAVTDQSLTASETFTYKAKGESAIYQGVVYGASETAVPDFAPKALESVYGLKPAYAKGLTGTGQTIVLLEGYGYPTQESDANAQFKLAGIPQLTSATYAVVYPDGTPDPNAGIDTGWNIEIALDIQSSHAIATGANIVVVATNGQDGEDFQYAMQYIIDNNLGTAVSDSWEEDQDLFAGAPEQQSYEDILELAAAKGISFQFSTGDGGDGGLGTPVGAPGVPSVAPHATAVGGTAILNNVGAKTFTTVSWGDAVSEIASPAPVIPPSAYYLGGGGGGESVYWPKPAWQQSLPGIGRQTPDVSALADPYTGFPLVITSGTTQYLEPGWGGTSLASPIFTAFWVLAQQAAGGALGQASPLLASLHTGLRDVVPFAAAGSITGTVKVGKTKTDYTTDDIFATALEGDTVFTGAIYEYGGVPQGYGFAFGNDTSLTTGPGWDNATGYGTPNGLAFINAVAAAAK